MRRHAEPELSPASLGHGFPWLVLLAAGSLLLGCAPNQPATATPSGPSTLPGVPTPPRQPRPIVPASPVDAPPELPALVVFTNAAAWVETDAPIPGGSSRVSPEILTATPWNELVVSWNVQPAEGAGLLIEAQAVGAGGESTRFYRLGQWSLGTNPPVVRTSLRGERDLDGVVRTDTLALTRPSRAVRLRLTLLGTLARHPEHLRRVALSLADTHQILEPRPGREDVRGRTLEVPERSQVAYAEGQAWCSPTSVSMILQWWAGELGRPDLDLDVPEVAAGVHDPAWPGTGNWPFNTAYAGSFPGVVACVARLRDLRAVEDLVAGGIPVVISVNAPALRGKPVTPDGGHLVICLGFTPEGDVVANDPWARLDEGQRVRRVYPRAYVEQAWAHSHRLAYLIAPSTREELFPAQWR